MNGKKMLAAVLSFGMAATAMAQVTPKEIVLGTILDLSGPLAALGKQVRQGMDMRVAEINEQGGIHGRKIRLIVEDSAYDPRRAVLAAQKLVDRDKVFAVVGSLGTAQTVATFPVLFAKNVTSFLPSSVAREMYEPFHKLKYAYGATYYDGVRLGLSKLIKEKSAKKVCIMYQDDEFGLEVSRGADAALKSLDLNMVERTTFKRGATDFSSQMQKLASVQCDLVVLGTILRETVGAMATAHRIGFKPTVFASAGAYSDLTHKLGGGVTEGLYVSHFVAHPYLDDSSQPIRFWASKYNTQFGDEPTVFSVYGYKTLDIFSMAATRAGTVLTPESLNKAMENLTVPVDIFGSPEMSFSPTKHDGTRMTRLSQIQNGRWKQVSQNFE